MVIQSKNRINSNIINIKPIEIISIPSDMGKKIAKAAAIGDFQFGLKFLL